MKIIEQSSIGKKNQEECEDGIITTDNFIAVIDGSTGKSPRRVSPHCSNGRLCMELIKQQIASIPPNANMEEFCKKLTERIMCEYKERGIDTARLALHPEERLTASVAVYSMARKEVWLIGDCQCIVNSVLYENPKPTEGILAGKRALFISEAIKNGAQAEIFRKQDAGRAHIIDELIESCNMQNKEYAVIDGFKIPTDKVKVINADYTGTEIILASDGYPQLFPTLEKSEAALKEQLEEDPLCIRTFKATKGLMDGYKSFDDRSFIRFSV